MITALALAAFLPPAGWRFDAIPATTTGIPKIPISVPSDWKTKERSPGELVFILPNNRWFVASSFSKKDADGREAADSSLDTLSNSRSRLPDTVKEWKVGSTQYATTIFSSRNTRKVRPITMLNFDIWNDRIHISGHLNISEVADVLFVQDFERIARSIRLPN